MSCWHLGGREMQKKLIGSLKEMGFFGQNVKEYVLKYLHFCHIDACLSPFIGPDLKINIIFEKVRF